MDFGDFHVKISIRFIIIIINYLLTWQQNSLKLLTTNFCFSKMHRTRSDAWLCVMKWNDDNDTHRSVVRCNHTLTQHKSFTYIIYLITRRRSTGARTVCSYFSKTKAIRIRRARCYQIRIATWRNDDDDDAYNKNTQLMTACCCCYCAEWI